MMDNLKAERCADEGAHWTRDAEGIRSFEPFSSGRTPEEAVQRWTCAAESELGPLSPLAQVEHPKEAD